MRARLREFTMEYDESGAGRPVLFIHGYPLNRAIWEAQLGGLADAARLIAPDLRGHGRSEAIPGPYSMDLLAGDCRELLDHIGITEPVVVCGHSMGGYAALAFERNHSDRVAALILVSTRAGNDSPEGKAARDQAIATVRADGLGAVFEGILPRMLSRTTYTSHPEIVERLGRIMASVSPAGVLGDLAGMRDRPDARPQLGTIRHPTLIIHGTDDQLIPLSEGEAMHSAIPGAQIRLIRGAGHLPCMEQPDEFNQEVRSFLAAL